MPAGAAIVVGKPKVQFVAWRMSIGLVLEYRFLFSQHSIGILKCYENRRPQFVFTELSSLAPNHKILQMG